jgi:hypothetical protein
VYTISKLLGLIAIKDLEMNTKAKRLTIVIVPIRFRDLSRVSSLSLSLIKGRTESY